MSNGGAVERRRRAIEGLAAALGAAAIFLALGLASLWTGHPDDDAFILFRYARNVAQGSGIVFNVAGPHAEGATDFLWMLGLSGLTVLGSDVAIAALVLNTLGAGLAAFVLCRALDTSSMTPGRRPLWLLLIVVCVPLLSAATAAYGGFSSMLYAALGVAALHASLEAGPRVIACIPFAALVLGLFRPDGVFAGAAIGVAGALRARDLGRERAYTTTAGAAGVLAGAYYVWRSRYFGLPLPLPLYVKSRTGDVEKLANMREPLRSLLTRLPGLGANLHWVVVGGVAGALAVIALAAHLLRRNAVTGIPAARLAVAVLPLAVLWGSLCFAHQSQNIDWRFQSMIQLGAIYFAVRGVSALLRRKIASQNLAWGMLGAVALPAIMAGIPRVQGRLSGGYGDFVNVFAARYGRELGPDSRIALTEAGRMPFWSTAQVLDAIGLNSPETALRPVSRKMLSDFDPQMLFFHHAGTLDLRGVPGGDPIVKVPSIAARVRPEYLGVCGRDCGAYSEVHVSNVRLAPLVMARFLGERADRYEVYAADPARDGTYSFVFAFRKDTDVARAAELLRESIRSSSESYLALLKERSLDGATRQTSQTSQPAGPAPHVLEPGG
jgi:hypothetical protein